MKTMQSKVVGKGKAARLRPFPNLKTAEVVEVSIDAKLKTAVVTYREKQ